MFKVQRILMPVDYSDVSRAALSMAVQLASQHGAELFMLHVHKDLDTELQRRIIYDPNGSVIEDAIVAEEQGLREALELEYQRAEESGAALKRVPTHLLVTGGDPVGVITQIVEDERIDVICTGTHGPRPGLVGWFRGTVSEKLVAQATCSVFVVKPQGYPYLRD
ncbi:MAG: universal stress protein [Alphaproteobacteria bacterium]|nr:universal stress protein [Alphaproteobacteria bacterium]MCB9796561.1 universal stress protein [Alphaproteobacteria bacterium]